ncbi:MAG: DsbE family thiol:disulfide interchange protein [Bdellovibrionales bacterium]
MRKSWRHVPAIFFMALVAVFFYALIGAEDSPKKSTPLAGKNTPVFSLATLSGKAVTLNSSDLTKGGNIAAINFFASWCVTCAAEQEHLSVLSDDFGVAVYGIAYKDSVPALQKWLKRHGNPFRAVGLDPNGRAAIDFGVSGVPETFLVGKDGRILYRHVGAIDRSAIDDVIAPLIKVETGK